MGQTTVDKNKDKIMMIQSKIYFWTFTLTTKEGLTVWCFEKQDSFVLFSFKIEIQGKHGGRITPPPRTKTTTPDLDWIIDKSEIIIY